MLTVTSFSQGGNSGTEVEHSPGCNSGKRQARLGQKKKSQKLKMWSALLC